MISPDMEVIKEVPGYRVILKAVLKSQIQQLIEQLALATNEESIILTASVADGTLSHLGSDSAKGFLQDHEDVKSQFLGYCLKTHHRKKQEEERRIAEEAQVRLQQQQQQVTPSKFSPGDPRGSFRARSPRFMAPRQQGALHPVTLTRAGPGVRHEPYSIQSPRRQMASSNSGPGASQAKKVKTEPEDTESAGEDSFHNVANEDENSKSSVGQNDGNQEGLGLGAEFSNFMSGDNTEHGNNSQGDFGAVDPNVKVKLEQTTDADMDELEITGVEPGHVMAPPPDSWDPNVSMTADPTGASGSQEDMASQQGYSPFRSLFEKIGNQRIRQRDGIGSSPFFESNAPIACAVVNETKYTENHELPCMYCDRTFNWKSRLLEHVIVHTKERPFVCGQCGQSFLRKEMLKRHIRIGCKDVLCKQQTG
ncbi:zinc finger and BTB domain-containing protein 37-like isoform X2 [Mya arenaria]|uniref:zinc finger and BTB domain-containing protein 37-like isoform X2 n=1 Tax=Mya arenaria TaxID=6604 RepID=UPI0022DF4165|nr:zinc finger and BTB domain-containing protein 37-like isoform X2 [Mya arenaria]